MQHDKRRPHNESAIPETGIGSNRKRKDILKMITTAYMVKPMNLASLKFSGRLRVFTAYN